MGVKKADNLCIRGTRATGRALEEGKAGGAAVLHVQPRLIACQLPPLGPEQPHRPHVFHDLPRHTKGSL